MLRGGFAVLAALAALLLVGCEGEPQPADDGRTPQPSSSQPPAQATSERVQMAVTLHVEDGELVDGPDEVELELGDPVLLEVYVDTPDELHVHGYEKTVKLSPGKETTLRFTADLPGIWEVELHHSGTVLTKLRVSG